MVGDGGGGYGAELQGAGNTSTGYYSFLGRTQGHSPWLVLIGLKLVEDCFTAAVILQLNPSPTGSCTVVFRRRKSLTCVLLY